MSDDKKEDLSLRDKLAIEILNGVLSNKELTGVIYTYFRSDYDARSASNKSIISAQIKAIIEGAYRAADLFREVRMNVFK